VPAVRRGAGGDEKTQKEKIMIRAKGKNGWFGLCSFRVQKFANGEVCVDIQSVREPASLGPIAFLGPKDQVADWFAALLKHISQEAYARFIVEANPEVLRALRFCVSVMKEQGIIDLSEKMAVEMAEKAIAKAESAAAWREQAKEVANA